VDFRILRASNVMNRPGVTVFSSAGLGRIFNDQPLAFNSSRMASERLNLWLGALIDVQPISAGQRRRGPRFAPPTRCPARCCIFSHAARADAASAAIRVLSAKARLVLRTHSKTTPRRRKCSSHHPSRFESGYQMRSGVAIFLRPGRAIWRHIHLSGQRGLAPPDLRG